MTKHQDPTDFNPPPIPLTGDEVLGAIRAGVRDAIREAIATERFSDAVRAGVADGVNESIDWYGATALASVKKPRPEP